MANEQYYYAVTRMHNHEQGLITEQDIQQLLLSSTVEDCFSILRTKGWGSDELPPLDSYALITFETNRVWNLLEELVGDITPFHIFRYAHDGNNLKAAIKLNYMTITEDTEKYFMPFGTISTEMLLNAAESHDFSSLPTPLDEVGRSAYEALVQTGNGQESDILVDKAILEMIYAKGKETGSNLLEEHASQMADIANIKTIIRGLKMGKNEVFFKRAIAPVGTLDSKKLVASALLGLSEVYQYLRETSYQEAVPALEESIPAFEAWYDNQLIEKLRPQKSAIGGIEPLAAFLLARKNEISMVRLILSAKANGIDADQIKQRMRVMYA